MQLFSKNTGRIDGDIVYYSGDYKYEIKCLKCGIETTSVLKSLISKSNNFIHDEIIREKYPLMDKRFAETCKKSYRLYQSIQVILTEGEFIHGGGWTLS